MKDTSKGNLLVILAFLIFGLMGVLARFISASPLLLLYSFQVVGLITFSLILLKNRKFSTGGMFKLIVVMTAFNLISDFSFFSAVKMTSISNAVFIKFTAPIFVLIIAPILIKEKSERRNWLAIPIALVGLFLIIYQNNLVFDANFNGILFSILTAITVAFSWTLIKKILKSLDVYSTLFYRFLISTTVLTPILFLEAPVISFDILLQLLLFGILFITIGTTIHMQGIKRIPIQRAGIFGYLEPLSASVYAILVFSEIPTLFTLTGGALILLSSYLVIRN